MCVNHVHIDNIITDVLRRLFVKDFSLCSIKPWKNKLLIDVQKHIALVCCISKIPMSPYRLPFSAACSSLTFGI